MPLMGDSIKKYSSFVEGEVNVIAEEIEDFVKAPYSANLKALEFMNRVSPHMASIEHKSGRNSMDYINISTEIVDIVIERTLDYIGLSQSNNVLDSLSPSDTVKFYSHQRENLEEALDICRKLENLNMDYAYRIHIFNGAKEKIINKCKEKGIETRTTAQKSLDQLKSVGEVTGVVAKETAGCVLTLAIKVVIVVVFFLILMAIIGVK